MGELKVTYMQTVFRELIGLCMSFIDKNIGKMKTALSI